MPQELKIRISNYKIFEEKLRYLGASFIETQSFVDTYFNQPQGKVLKLAQINNQFFLQSLSSVDGKFDIDEKRQLHETEARSVQIELTHQYGINSVLRGKRIIYQLNDFKLTLNLIEDLGEFLILTGENPTEDFIIEKLEIKNPEYIRISFDELISTKQEK